MSPKDGPVKPDPIVVSEPDPLALGHAGSQSVYLIATCERGKYDFAMSLHALTDSSGQNSPFIPKGDCDYVFKAKRSAVELDCQGSPRPSGDEPLPDRTTTRWHEQRVLSTNVGELVRMAHTERGPRSLSAHVCEVDRPGPKAWKRQRLITLVKGRSVGEILALSRTADVVDDHLDGPAQAMFALFALSWPRQKLVFALSQLVSVVRRECRLVARPLRLQSARTVGAEGSGPALLSQLPDERS